LGLISVSNLITTLSVVATAFLCKGEAYRQRRAKRKRLLVSIVIAGPIVYALLGFCSGANFSARGLSVLLDRSSACWGSRGRPAPTQIFEGITYGCERLEPSDEGSGFVHWVRIDLAAPGIELYVTPMDPTAVSRGWQYRLRRVEDVVNKEQLAVAINGTMFTSNSSWLRMSGDFAKSVETVVADHVVSHVWIHTYLLWFDDQLTPHLRSSKPPTAAELAMAKWGIGGQGVWQRDDNAWPDSSRSPDCRTAIAIDQPRKLLFLVVGDNISPRLMLQKVADLGAKYGMLLDGGGSSSMAIGEGAAGVSPGIVSGGWRPVATHFGVRAKRLRVGGQ
jgi:hypothetical protein